MNPWAALIIVLALLLIIVAWKGTQDNVLSAVLNRPYQGASSSGATQASFAVQPGGTAATLPGVTNPSAQTLAQGGAV